jgi:hypothetical protein
VPPLSSRARVSAPSADPSIWAQFVSLVDCPSPASSLKPKRLVRSRFGVTALASAAPTPPASTRHNVRNVVWLTADVHDAAAHHYDPAHAAFTEFDPFWEFVAGPINAGTFGRPTRSIQPLGPSAEFIEAALTPSQLPTDGRQYYGVVDTTRHALDVRLKDIAGTTLFSIRLDASN